MTKNNNPWMASSAYQEADFYKFKGRDEDTQHLLTMLLQNESVICYAASGEGKSSLINAGVCPELRKNGLFPIKITFTTAEYQGEGLPQNSEGKIDFDKLIAEKIDLDIRRNIQSCIEKFHLAEGEYTIASEKIPKYNNVEISNSLWWKLRTETIQVPFGEYDYIPVLIFDQFEEIFRAKWKADFFKWLEELMRDVCPDNIVAKYDGSNDDLPNSKLFKTLFSMRYEYVGELDYWCSQKTYIPQMMLNRYFLKPLSLKQAVSIIENQDIEDEVSNKLRNSSASIADGIKNKGTDEDQVSAIILSIVCYDLYEKLFSEQNFTINEENINEIINHSISSFYENAISRIKRKGSDNSIPLKHIKIIENVLVDEKGHRLRLPVDISELKEIDFERDYREALETAHLIRSYKVNDETYVELIHDRLAEVITEKRTYQELHNKRLYKWAILGLLALAIIVFGFVMMKVLSKESKDDVYTLLLKALPDSTFSEDDHWKARIIINTQDGKQLIIQDTINCDTLFERGKSEVLSLSFTKRQIDSLGKLSIIIQPITALCKFNDTTIILNDLIKDTESTFFIPINKNIEETVTVSGQVFVFTNETKRLNHVLIAMGEKITYTNNNGEFNLSVPRGTQLKTIYAIKEGYRPNFKRINNAEREYITFLMERDSSYKFQERWNSFEQLWDMAGYNERDNSKTTIRQEAILKEFNINKEKKDLKRQLQKNNNDTLYKYIFYAPESMTGNNNKDNNITIEAANDKTPPKGAVRIFIGSDLVNHRLLEGTMTMINPDSSLWKIEAEGLDSIFNTYDMKGTIIKEDHSSTFLWE